MCCSDIVACSLEQMNLSFRKTMKWWEKGLQTNMRAIQTARDLVESLTNAGDRLVIVDFFSPGCAGCHALHPKVILRSSILQCCMPLVMWIQSCFSKRYITFRCAGLSVCGAEPGCAVPAGELRGAQIYVPQPSCSCVPFLQILQGSWGPALQLQLYQRNCKIWSFVLASVICVPCSNCCENWKHVKERHAPALSDARPRN